MSERAEVVERVVVDGEKVKDEVRLIVSFLCISACLEGIYVHFNHEQHSHSFARQWSMSRGLIRLHLCAK